MYQNAGVVHRTDKGEGDAGRVEEGGRGRGPVLGLRPVTSGGLVRALPSVYEARPICMLNTLNILK